MSDQIVVLSPRDNVAVAIQRLEIGAVVQGVIVRETIGRGHKLALRAIAAGEPIVKYGEQIGYASEGIEAGDHVHVQNIGPSALVDRPSASPVAPAAIADDWHRRTFQGYRRASGRVGTRNFIGVLTSVNCAATAAKSIVTDIAKRIDLSAYPEVSGIAAFPHSSGCGMSDQGLGFELLKRTLHGYASHPNFGGILMVGLGCEQFQIQRLVKECNLTIGENFDYLVIQEEGGTQATVEAGVARLQRMLPHVAKARREPCPISELSVALQCGGSDSYSGITANPALGRAMDILVGAGGTAILTETPEIYGAEHLLAARARDAGVQDRLYARIAWWESYAKFFGNVLNNNPSPGNKAGGLTTIMEKSLGAIAKGGSTTLEQVVDYAEQPSRRGLIFMDGPGFDPCSATGQIASGANVLCFTTGRGSAFGCKPVPSIKLATNEQLYERMVGDMDINCGDIINGTSLDAKGIEILDTIITIASGERTKSETLGYGDLEFIPWQLYAVL